MRNRQQDTAPEERAAGWRPGTDDAPEERAAGWRLGKDDVIVGSSLALLLFSAYVLNASIFPVVAQVFPAGREISTYCGAAFSVVVAVAAYRRPAVLREGAWSLTCLTLFALGVAVLGAGLETQNALLVSLGSPFGGIGSVWFSVLVGLGLIQLGARRSMIVIPTAFVVKYAAQFGFTFALAGGTLPLVAALVLYFACLATSYALIRSRVRGMIGVIRTSASPTVLDATNPSSFLPFSSLVYVSIFLFNAAFGYVFGSQEQALSQAATLMSFLPVIAVFFVVVAARARLSADVPADLHWSSLLLYAGSVCFTVLTYFLIPAVGSRNPVGALSTSAFAFAASWLGIGCGALLVQGIQAVGALDATALLWVSAAVTFLFMAYNFLTMKRFSFEDAIRGVQSAHVAPAAPADEGAEGESRDALRLNQVCDQVIAQFGLTPREGDVLRLLARGRTSPVIQEKLVLSHNTVKTHVRHIYAKLGIHSQQELIDIVEGTER